MRSKGAVWLRSVVVLAALAAPSRAEDAPWRDGYGAPAAELLAAANAVEIDEAAPVAVLWDETRYEIDRDGRTTETSRLVYQVRNQAGVEGWAYTAATWAPWRQDSPAMRARVVQPDGREIVLDPSTLSEAPAAGAASSDVYDDRRTLEAPLAGVVVGAVVEEEQVVREHTPLSPVGLNLYRSVERPGGSRGGRLTIVAPSGTPLRYRAYEVPGARVVEEDDGTVARLEIEWGVVEARDRLEVGQPSDRARFRSIEIGSGASWAAVADWYGSVVEGQLGPATGDLLEALAIETRDRREVAEQTLAAIHRQVRYTGLSLGTGGIVPAPPAETLDRRFGDCKDQSLLLVAALRAAGHPAHLALLLSGPGKDVDPDLPGFGRFDHAIVHVPGDPELWIDPTDVFARVAELPVGVQGRRALIVAPGTRGLVRIPASEAMDNRVVETREVRLADYGFGSVIEETVYSGSLESAQRDYTDFVDEEDRREGYRDYFQYAYLASESTVEAESEPRDLTAPFRVRIAAREAGRAVTALDEAVVAIRWEGLLEHVADELLEETDLPRETEYEFLEPFEVEWRYRIVPPAGFTPRALPALEERRLGTTTLRTGFELVKGVIEGTIQFSTGPRRISAGEFTATRDALLELVESPPLLVELEAPGLVDLRAGRGREALEVLRELVDREPEVAVHRVRLASALLELGFGEEARVENRRAVEIAPESFLAWWRLGIVLQHDDLGRQFGEGWLRDEAIAALEKAVEIGSSDEVARIDLAILLEHDGEGRRYAPGADLERAVAEYRTYRELTGSGAIDQNLLVALLWSRQWDEIPAVVEGLEVDDGVARTWSVLASALQDGSAAARRKARQLFPEDAKRSAALLEASGLLTGVREYGAAADLASAAAVGAPNPALVLERAALLRRIRPLEELDLEVEDPASLGVRFVVRLLAPEGVGEDARRLFHPALLEGGSGSLEEELKEAHEGIDAMEGLIPGWTVRQLLEVGISAAQVDVAGDAERGYRITQRFGVGDGAVASSYFASVHEGLPKIVVVDEDDREGLAREALRRLDLGDVVGARLWLDWALDREPTRISVDPLDGSGFRRLWKKGSAASAEQARLAAVALLAESSAAGAEEALDPLGKQLEGDLDDAIRLALQLSRLAALRATEAWEEALALSQELAAGHPDSEIGFNRVADALDELDRPAEMVSLANARLERLPEDPAALKTLLQAAAARGDAAEAIDYCRRLESQQEADAMIYNEWAWLELFAEPVPEESLERARRSAELSGYLLPPALHTLATAYAELGDPAQARQVLLQAIGSRSSEEPLPVDWYVMARIADRYGLADVARKLYRRVIDGHEGEESPFATAELARRRLSGAAAAR